MELWFTEKQTENHGITTKVKRTLHHEVTEFQKLDVIETAQFGNMLVLDGMVMTTDKDEFVYHEMITHIAMNTHPHPEQVLVVGGGDGGVIREVLRYPTVKRAVLAEIDGKVIEASKKYFPAIAGMLDDPRVDVQVTDGVRYIQENKGRFDVIIVDSTEPIGPAVGLFQKPFYEGISEALKEDGIMVAQTDTPWFKPDLIRQVFRDISSTFPIARTYTANIPTYPSGLWSFTLGSKKYDPLEVNEDNLKRFDTRYYRPELHKAVFRLPAFVEALVSGGEE
ncbi:polyamine aminopropyltransferase [Staphylospora marina]|uniref:polyamine aminopropyltransferase n=1 Tax=Staphylospora marina TaxID=2490858 RepID=UPI000F5C01EE|nr:polyamine aminopropyltransferase [Staphylospora marina]